MTNFYLQISRKQERRGSVSNRRHHDLEARETCFQRFPGVSRTGYLCRILVSYVARCFKLSLEATVKLCPRHYVSTASVGGMLPRVALMTVGSTCKGDFMVDEQRRRIEEQRERVYDREDQRRQAAEERRLDQLDEQRGTIEEQREQVYDREEKRRQKAEERRQAAEERRQEKLEGQRKRVEDQRRRARS